MRLRPIVAALAVVWAACLGASACFARDDFQSWSSLELIKRLGPDWEFAFLPEIRIQDDASDLFYHE